MGPPRLNEKLDRIHRVYFLEASNSQTTKAGGKIRTFLKDTPELRDQLALFTFGEYKAFLNTIGKPETIGKAIADLGSKRFKEQLRDYSQYVMLKLSDLEALRSLDIVKWKDLAELRRKKPIVKKLPKEIRSSEVVRYLADWQQSKEQY